MKFSYKMVSKVSDQDFEDELNRHGQRGFRVMKMFDCESGQKALMEKQIWEPPDRRGKDGSQS